MHVKNWKYSWQILDEITELAKIWKDFWKILKGNGKLQNWPYMFPRWCFDCPPVMIYFHRKNWSTASHLFLSLNTFHSLSFKISCSFPVSQLIVYLYFGFTGYLVHLQAKGPAPVQVHVLPNVRHSGRTMSAFNPSEWWHGEKNLVAIISP